jgi:hypothetical protein
MKQLTIILLLVTVTSVVPGATRTSAIYQRLSSARVAAASGRGASFTAAIRFGLRKSAKSRSRRITCCVAPCATAQP